MTVFFVGNSYIFEVHFSVFCSLLCTSTIRINIKIRAQSRDLPQMVRESISDCLMVKGASSMIK
jgi:hypothetical protein